LTPRRYSIRGPLSSIDTTNHASAKETNRMSEKLLKFLLSELQTVRIICHAENCGVVTELPLAILAQRQEKKEPRCPHCNASFDPGKTEKDFLIEFAKAVQQLVA
jgi:hypothetical protein